MKRMVWGTVLSVGAIVLGVCLSPASVFAVWVDYDAVPEVVSIDQIEQRSLEYCDGIVSRKVVDGLGVVTVCLFSLKPMVGQVLSGSSFRIVKAEPYESTLYLVDGVCEHRMLCVYRSQADALVAREPDGSTQRLRIHHRFLDSLEKYHSSTEGGTRYRYSGESDPVKAADGSKLHVNAFTVSLSGRWVLAEVRNAGTVRIDTTTMDVLRITDRAFKYGVGRDPFQQLAISNDGRAAVVTGRNSGYAIFAIVDGCGEPVMRPIPIRFTNGHRGCLHTDSAMSTRIEDYDYAHHPRFSEDSEQLTVELDSDARKTYRVLFQKPGTQQEAGISYIAMGDSFTSGEGEVDDSWYQNVTPADTSCHRSIRAYPFELHTLRQDSGSVFNVACSGARLDDIWAEGAYQGQGGRVSEESTALSYRATSLAQGGGGVVRQSVFLEEYQPKNITLSIGGNDVGIIAKLKTCASFGTCHWVRPEWRAAIRDEIDRYSGELSDTIRRIQQLSPSTRIALIGYPDPIQPEGSCDAVTRILFSKEERQLLRHMVQRLNVALYEAATTVGIPYYDVFNATKDTQLCSANPTSMNGLRFGDDAGPFEQLPWLRLIGAESFHPTPIGHTYVAQHLSRAVPASQPPIADSSYWEANDHMADLEQTSLRYEPVFIQYADSRIVFSIPAGLLTPGSTAEAFLYSEPTQLGAGVVRDDGSFNLAVVVDKAIEPGQHTAMLQVKSDRGPDVRLYREIYIPPNDVNFVQEATGRTPRVSSEVLGVSNERSIKKHSSIDLQSTAKARAPFKSVPANGSSLNPSVLAARASGTPRVTSALQWQYIALFALVGIIAVWLLYVLLLRK